MSCDCIKRIQKLLHNQGYMSARIDGVVWLFDGGTQMATTFTYETLGKRGNVKRMKKNLTFSNCPFCGIEYQKLNKTTAETAKLGADAIDQPILRSAT